MIRANENLLDFFEGRKIREDEQNSGPVWAGPTLVLIDEPLEELEVVAALMDELEGSEGRRRNRWLARQKNTGIAVGEEGPVLNGRRCCYQLARKLDRRLSRLRLPSRHFCPECGTEWEVRTTVREARPHV